MLKFANNRKNEKSVPTAGHELNTGDLGNASQKKSCLLEHGKKYRHAEEIFGFMCEAQDRLQMGICSPALVHHIVTITVILLSSNIL